MRKYFLKERRTVCKWVKGDNKYFFLISARPQGKSYLFFTQFKMELKGTKIAYANAFVSIKKHVSLNCYVQMLSILFTRICFYVANWSWSSTTTASLTVGSGMITVLWVNGGPFSKYYFLSANNDIQLSNVGPKPDDGSVVYQLHLEK